MTERRVVLAIAIGAVVLLPTSIGVGKCILGASQGSIEWQADGAYAALEAAGLEARNPGWGLLVANSTALPAWNGAVITEATYTPGVDARPPVPSEGVPKAPLKFSIRRASGSDESARIEAVVRADVEPDELREAFDTLTLELTAASEATRNAWWDAFRANASETPMSVKIPGPFRLDPLAAPPDEEPPRLVHHPDVGVVWGYRDGWAFEFRPPLIRFEEERDGATYTLTVFPGDVTGLFWSGKWHTKQGATRVAHELLGEHSVQNVTLDEREVWYDKC